MVSAMQKNKAGRKAVRKYVWGVGGNFKYVRELTWNMMFEQRPKGNDRAEPH